MDPRQSVALDVLERDWPLGIHTLSEYAAGVAGKRILDPFAGESAPAGEDSEGDELALAEGGFRTRTLFRRLGLAKVVNHDIKCGEEGVHIDHEELVPFPSGSGSRPTLERGCLPLKFRADNSHQAFNSCLSVGVESSGRSARVCRCLPESCRTW